MRLTFNVAWSTCNVLQPKTWRGSFEFEACNKRERFATIFFYANLPFQGEIQDNDLEVLKCCWNLSLNTFMIIKAL